MEMLTLLNSKLNIKNKSNEQSYDIISVLHIFLFRLKVTVKLHTRL